MQNGTSYPPKSEAQPEQKPTTSDKMRGKGKKKAEAKPSDQSEVSGKSDQSDKAEKIEDYGEKKGKTLYINKENNW